MIEYDPKIIQQLADRLYRQAKSTVISFTVFGALVGGGGGAAAGPTPPSAIGGLVGAVILGLFGFLIGQEIAFHLKVRAQTVLCQLRIEENTRRWLGAEGGGAGLE